MAFTLKGEMIETCSCNMLCPCWYGVKELMIMDQGWCATTILFRIEAGSVDGVDLSGLNAAVGFFFPGPTMFDADGTGRLYVDDRISPEQEAALESIVQAKIGGPMEVPCSLLSRWLPTTRARIDVTARNGDVHATVDGFGEISSKRLVNDLGDRMTMQNTGFVLAFQYENNTAELAPSDGTVWRDPDMPEVWDNKSGAVGQINWQVA